MKGRGYFYDALSLSLLGGSLYFFHQATRFLVEKDYIAATLTLLMGFCVIKVGVGAGRLALVARRRAREEGRR